MSSSSSPCAACKLLRRKCTQGCVFAPYFPPDQPSKFANVHKVFGASNVAKLLNELPPAQREDAVNSLAYEADARLRDPVYGCVAYISILQLKIKQVRDDLATARKELASYIGPAAFAPFHPVSAAAPYVPAAHHHYHHQPAHYAPMGLSVGVSTPHAHAQMMQQQQHHHHHQQMVEAQQMAAAVEVAREQDMMLRHAAAYGHAVSGATVAVVPPGPAQAYENQPFILQQQQQQQQQVPQPTYRIEPSSPLPPSSAHSHVEVPQAQQQHRDGSDEGSGGGVVPPA